MRTCLKNVKWTVLRHNTLTLNTHTPTDTHTELLIWTHQHYCASKLSEYTEKQCLCVNVIFHVYQKAPYTVFRLKVQHCLYCLFQFFSTWGVGAQPFTGVTYQMSCISDIYIPIHNNSRITVMKLTTTVILWLGVTTRWGYIKGLKHKEGCKPLF